MRALADSWSMKFFVLLKDPRARHFQRHINSGAILERRRCSNVVNVAYNCSKKIAIFLTINQVYAPFRNRALFRALVTFHCALFLNVVRQSPFYLLNKWWCFDLFLMIMMIMMIIMPLLGYENAGVDDAESYGDRC